MGLQHMKQRVLQSGVTLLDEQIKDAQDALEYGFYDDISYASQVYFWIPGDSPRKGQHLDIKLYNNEYSSAVGRTQKFLTKHSDVVEVGDYIYNESDNSYWICTESFNVANIHHEGCFTMCNWFLRWQRPDGTILEYPCQDMNATQYNSGEASNNYMTLGSSQHMEVVQATEDTLALASPQRFYVDKGNQIPYIVTQNDSTAHNYGKGICQITVMQDVIHEGVDRPDLGICDYISPTAHPEDNDETTVLSNVNVATILGNKKLKIGFGRTYTANLVDENGTAIDWSDKYSWNIVSDFEVDSSVDNDKISLMIEDEDFVDSTFNLQVVDNDGLVITQTTITVIGMF